MTRIIYFVMLSMAVCQFSKVLGQAEPVDCTLPADPGPCDAIFERYFYNASSGKCEMFVYGGCGGNTNNFETVESCQAECGQVEPINCTLPADPGPCDEFLEHYFYNTSSGKCEKFIYGGCGGNSNNFETLESCQAECGVVAVSVDCTLFVDPGPCQAEEDRYFFNITSGKCQHFIYGGCSGNSNKFLTYQMCEDACIADT